MSLVAVTGATGFLGGHVCDELLQRGLAVRAAARPTSDLRWLRGKPLETVEVDLADAASLDAFLAGCTGVIHCAGALGAASTDVYERVNVELTAAVLEAAARARTVAAFVFVSSLAAHGPASLAEPAVETSPLRPINAYGRSKRDAEALVHERDWPFRTVTLRPPSLYGPRDREFLPFYRLARRGWIARVGTRMSGLSLVDGRDAAAAAVALLVIDGASGAYFVDDGPGGDEAARDAAGRHWAWGYDFAEMARAHATVWQRRQRLLTIPPALVRVVAALAPPALRRRSPVLEPDRLADLKAVGWVCDATRLRRDTDWRPRRDYATGLRETREFLESNGWL